MTPVLWLDLLNTEVALHYAATAADAGLQALLRRSLPNPALLRAQLTDPGKVVPAVLTWLRAGGVKMTGAAEALIKWAIVEPAEHRGLGDVLHKRGLSRRSLSTGIVVAFGVRPEGIFQVFRLLGIALQLQRDQTRAVSEVAETCGYYDAAALRRRLNEVLGSGPRDIRGRLGWEWLLHDAMRRNGVIGRHADHPLDEA